MKTLTGLVAAAGLVLAATPALADDAGAPVRAGAFAAPAQLTQSQRDNYRAVFAALHADRKSVV